MKVFSDSSIRRLTPRPSLAISVLLAMAILGLAIPSNAQETSSGQTESTPTPAPEKTQAERIIELRQAIERDRALLEEVQAEMESPESEYNQAEEDFQQLDERLKTVRKELEKAEQANEAGEAESLREEIASLEEQHRLAKERFELAIQEREAKSEQAQALESSIEKMEALLAQLEGKTTEKEDEETTPAGKQETPAPAPEEGEQTPQPPTSPTQMALGAAAEALSPDGTPAPEEEELPRPEVIEAQQEAEEKQEEAKQAEEQARTLTEQIEALKDRVESQRKQVATARDQVQNARAQVESLENQISQKEEAGAPSGEIEELKNQLGQAETRQSQRRQELQTQIERLQEAQSELAAAQADQIAVLQEAETKRAAAEEATERLESLQSPFHPANIKAWFLDNGIKILITLFVVFLLHWFLRGIRSRLLVWLAHHAKGTATERMARARTLVSVIHNTAIVVIDFGAALVILNNIGIPAGPLFGGAAIGGLAVAFGAQNLIRDYFTGFVILLENQYSINDVIMVGDKAGLVEKITLRMTVLRDLEGRVHFIPNGKIDSVTNLSYGWARAVFDVGIAYKEDVDRVMEVIQEIGKEMRESEEFGPKMLEDVVMLGVDAMTDSAVVVKFMVKTQPLEQWGVKREMLRRVKKRFDDEGIEIPFSQQTVHHRFDDDSLARLGMRGRAGDGEQPPNKSGGGGRKGKSSRKSRGKAKSEELTENPKAAKNVEADDESDSSERS